MGKWHISLSLFCFCSSCLPHRHIPGYIKPGRIHKKQYGILKGRAILRFQTAYVQQGAIRRNYLMTVTIIILAVLAVFIGALTRATFGFGEAVVSMPLLALLPISLHTSISLIGLAGLTVAGMTITSSWRHVDRSTLIWLSVATLLGIPCGLALVTFAPAIIVRRFLGVFLVIYSVYSLARGAFAQPAIARAWLSKWGWILPFGFAAGVLGSAYNVTGIPVVVYGTLRRWEQSRFHGTLQAHFLVAGVFVVIGQALGGLWTANLFILYGLSLPAIIIATLLGMVLHRRIPTEKFKQYVFFVILVLGALLLVNIT
jgi:uncharacterized membrane protein YfcA